jgi:hypothetical protein
MFCVGGGGQHPPGGQGNRSHEVSKSHTTTHQSREILLWTSDQPVAETTHNTHNRQIFMPPLGFEPTISVG